MSEMVHDSGKLIPFEFTTENMTIYEMACEINDAGHAIDMNDSVEYECIVGKGVVTVQGVVYIIQDIVNGSPDDEYCNVTDNGDGTFNFDTVYYNGSSFLEEQLEEAFDKE